MGVDEIFSRVESSLRGLEFEDQRDNASRDALLQSVPQAKQDFETLLAGLEAISPFLQEKLGNGLEFTYSGHTFSYDRGPRSSYTLGIPVLLKLSSVSHMMDFNALALSENRINVTSYLTIPLGDESYCIGGVMEKDLMRRLYPYLALASNPLHLLEMKQASVNAATKLQIMLESIGYKVETPKFAPAVTDLKYDEKGDIIYFDAEFLAHYRERIRFKGAKTCGEAFLPFAGIRYNAGMHEIIDMPFPIELPQLTTHEPNRQSLMLHMILYLMQQPDAKALLAGENPLALLMDQGKLLQG